VEIAAHAGWITGMDLASQSGLLISSAEDSFVRVSKKCIFKLSHFCHVTIVAGVATVGAGRRRTRATRVAQVLDANSGKKEALAVELIKITN
jgi:hypothetical protein